MDNGSYDIATLNQIRISVFDWNKLGSNDLLGCCSLLLGQQFRVNETVEGWFDIASVHAHPDKNGKPAGQVYLKIAFHPGRINRSGGVQKQVQMQQQPMMMMVQQQPMMMQQQQQTCLCFLCLKSVCRSVCLCLCVLCVCVCVFM
jgi:hypothetical protein